MNWKRIVWPWVFLWVPSLFAMEGWIEGGTGIFRPDSKTLREIFGSVWLNSRVELAAFVWRDLALFGQFDYLNENGRSLGGQQKVEFTLMPLSLGLKWIHPVTHWLDVYPALAFRYNLGWEKTNYPFVRKHVFHQAAGGSAAVGCLLCISHFFLDLNLGYSLAQFGAPSTPTNVEGNSLWIGGISFLTELGWKL